MGKLLNKSRLEALTDGVYAIAMTILVLNIDVATISNEAGKIGLGQALWGLAPEFYSYVLGFLLLGSLWLVHNKQYRRIKLVDEGFVWVNIIGLVLICLIPFSASLISQYESDLTAVIFFHVNLLLAGLSYLWQWLYIVGRPEMAEGKIKKSEVKQVMYRNLMLPAIAIVAIGVAFFSSEWSSLAYLLIPVVRRFL